jgi:rSAM/selenodomain-associated transferase 1
LSTVAVAIVCKTPAAGQSKTRLSPPLRPEECAAISSCFIRDLSQTIGSLAQDGGVTGYAIYTPRGSEHTLRTLLPDRFELTPQCDGALGERLIQATADLLGAGHDGAILINSDSPTLPVSILRAAVDALRGGDKIVLSPALDGGYMLIGLKKPHRRLFENIPWSTSEVYRLTLDRAAEIGMPVASVPGWYDIDDAASLRMLEDELSGRAPAFSAIAGAEAPATRRFLLERRRAVTEPTV